MKYLLSEELKAVDAVVEEQCGGAAQGNLRNW
jgi:hypothetical protein